MRYNKNMKNSSLNTSRYSLAELTKRTTVLIDILDERGVHAVPEVLDGFRSLGYVSSAHSDPQSDWVSTHRGTRECLEWYVGQLIEALDAHRWGSINGIVNRYGNHCPTFLEYSRDHTCLLSDTPEPASAG